MSGFYCWSLQELKAAPEQPLQVNEAAGPEAVLNLKGSECQGLQSSLSNRFYLPSKVVIFKLYFTQIVSNIFYVLHLPDTHTQTKLGLMK